MKEGINFEQEAQHKQTSESLRNKVDTIINLFIKDFSIDGKEKLISTINENPEEKFIVTASHLSNLDAPSAIKSLGDILDMQIAVDGSLFSLAPHALMFNIAGKENFSPLEYKKVNGKMSGSFNPENFERIAEHMEEGKTPWIAIHPFTITGVMQDPRIGPVYLAHKTGAKIIPTALEVHGNSINLEGPIEMAKGIAGRISGDSKAIFHIGEVIDLPEMDVNIIETVINKRANHEQVSPEEKELFKETTNKLREEADKVAKIISEMLPQEQRGK